MGTRGLWRLQRSLIRALWMQTKKRAYRIPYKPAQMVGVLRFELKASASRTQRATNCAIPRKENGSFCCRLVAEEGFEPSQCESESQVLPLHNSASNPLTRKRDASFKCLISIQRISAIVKPFSRFLPENFAERPEGGRFLPVSRPVSVKYRKMIIFFRKHARPTLTNGISFYIIIRKARP